MGEHLDLTKYCKQGKLKSGYDIQNYNMYINKKSDTSCKGLMSTLKHNILFKPSV